MNFGQFLQWILSSGGSVIATSFILERIAWFQSKTADVKEWIFFGVTAVISVLAYLGVTYLPVEVINSITPFFLIVSGLFVNIIVGKMFHQVDKKEKVDSSQF